ncbi:MAG: VTT domain-containing protein [Candidatus Korarchaeota archaeon]|nr:VTT domain-containing protein [Candidatus Korarchaeota archaeon]
MSLTEILIETVSAWIRELGWLGVFGGVMVETAITLIPSPLVPMAAGFSLIPPHSSPMYVLYVATFTIGLVGSVAATLGSLAHYALGYYGGKPLVERFGKYLGISWEEIESFSDRIRNKRKWLGLFFSRALPIIPLSPVSIGAGIIRMDPYRFSLFTLLGAFPRYFVLGIAGYLLGIAYEGLVSVLDTAETAVAIIMVFGIAGYISVKRRTRKGDKEASRV